MSFQDSQVGSLSGSYWEYVSRQGDDSPRSNMVSRPGLPANKPTYSQWNNYTWIRRSYLGSMVKCSYNPPGPAFRPDYTTSAYYAGDGFGLGPRTDPDTWKLLSKLVQKWKNSDLNLGVSIVEGRESFAMIAEKLRGLAQAAHALRRGNLGGALQHFSNPVPRSARKRAAKRLSQGDISGSWLALNLGWAPMIQDIYAGLEYAGSEGGYAIIRTPWVSGSISAIPNGSGAPRFVRKSEKYRSRLVCEVRTPPEWYDRLGLTNPALVAWELVPFSFVVDYFLPIGESIEALTALRIDRGRMMQETRIKVTASYPSLPSGALISSGTWLYSAKPETKHSYRSYTRRLTSVTDLMVVKSATISLPTSLKRLSNMAALLHQQLLGIKIKSTFTR